MPVTLGWISDTKDSAILPTRGALQKAAIEVAIPGGDCTFYKLSYQQQRFFPVTRNMVLMLNGELGYAGGLSGQQVPFYRNFYAGGIGSVRGYDPASLGPYEYTNGDIVRLGGTRRVVFNAELSMPLPGFGVDKSVGFWPILRCRSGLFERKLPDGGIRPGRNPDIGWSCSNLDFPIRSAQSPALPQHLTMRKMINSKSSSSSLDRPFNSGEIA